jgi:predicted permease
MVGFAGVLPTLLPAVQATRLNLMRSMRLETTLGQRRSVARSAFVIAQIAGSTAFIATALLFVRSFWTTAASDPGFETKHLLVAEIKPTDYGYDAAKARVLFDNLLERLRQLPAVEKAAIADRVSFYVGFPRVAKVSADGSSCATADCRTAYVYAVGAGFFDAMGIPLRYGREFRASEIQSGDAVIVSQGMAERVWPGRNAIGEWLREGPEGRLLQVVGVAADIVHHRFGESSRDYVYRPLRSNEYGDTITLIVRTAGEARLFVNMVRDEIRALDPNLPPSSTKSMDQRMELPLWPVRTAAGFFLVCGTLALVLATVGLFGMTYLTVSQRTREFGVRVALGATRSRVMTLVIGESLWLTLPGIAIGLTGALIVGYVLASSFFSIASADPTTYAATAALQAAVALAACLLPAYRATTADPMLALREP